MNWADEAEKILKTWADTQEQLWKSWAPPETSESPEDAWSRGLELWQQSIRQTLEAQAEAMKMWANLAQQGGATAPEFGRYFPALQAMFGQWTTAQQQLWSQWVETLKSIDPGKLHDKWQDQGDELMQQFSESTNQMMDAQQKAMAQFLEAFRS
jgi:hypothetical protein